MDDQNKLLVRVYNVGFGDCIYVRVPDQYEEGGQTKLQHRHILIDCGSVSTKGLGSPLKAALEDVYKMLDKGNGKKRLDLLVVTHLHADHLSGFDPKRFENIAVRHVWLTAFMNKNHPQAPQSHALQALARRAALSLLQQGLQLGPGVKELLLSRLSNDECVTLLSETIPAHSEPGKPLYVCRDIADPDPQKEGRLSAQQGQAHKVQFERGTTCFADFRETGTRLRVLAPEWNIDGYYLGKGSCDYRSLLKNYAEPENPEAWVAAYSSEQDKAPGETKVQPVPLPRNVSSHDFLSLRTHLFYSALRFSQEDDELKNNTSVVLLLEWRGRRLLFAADAEWGGGYDQKQDRNSCWDVLLMMDKKQGHLSKALDFLKVGHHGSTNATPWNSAAKEQSVLKPMLPPEGKASIVVSTRKTARWPTVPCEELMDELGKRGEVLRTDRVADLKGKTYIERVFDGAP